MVRSAGVGWRGALTISRREYRRRLSAFASVAPWRRRRLTTRTARGRLCRHPSSVQSDRPAPLDGGLRLLVSSQRGGAALQSC